MTTTLNEKEIILKEKTSRFDASVSDSVHVEDFKTLIETSHHLPRTTDTYHQKNATERWHRTKRCNAGVQPGSGVKLGSVACDEQLM